MPARVLYAGGRIECVQNVVGAVVATNANYNSSYADCSMQLPNGGSFDIPFYDASMNPINIGDNTTIYMHCDCCQRFYNNDTPCQTLYDNANHPWVRVMSQDQACYLQYNSGTGASPVWTAIPGTATGWGVAPYTIDVQVIINSAGGHHAAIFINGATTPAAGNFTQAGFNNASFWRMTSRVADITYYSQMMCTELIPTVGGFVKTARGTGAGFYSQWSGSVTDVNQALDNTSTSNQATSAGLNQSYPMTNVTVPAGYGIATVFYWLRGKNTGGSPSNIKTLYRKGTSDFIGAANLPNIGIGFSPLGARFDVDPATGVAWTQAGWNTPVQFGFQSEA